MNSNDIKKVLVTDDVNQKCLEILENNDIKVVKNTKLSIDELKAEIKNYDCLVVRSATKVTKEIISAAKTPLKLIARAGTGVDNIDVDAATEHGVLVMNALGSNTISAAELACAMIMNLARSLPAACQSMKEGKWERSKFMGTELYGKCLAVVGLGRVGKEVANRMRAFGMRIIGYDPIVSADEAERNQIEFMQLEALWPLADYITVHVPLMAETRNLIDAAVIGKCKRGFRLVNCARGGIVDESALLDALRSGQCAGAGLDVFDQEPTRNFDLVNHVNVVCTPHLGASSVEAQNRVAVDIAEQIVKYVKTGVVDGGGETKVISAIKAELDTPDVMAPNSGKIDFFVDCSANAAPEFQGRGGDEIASQIVNLLTNMYSSKNFDLTQLCIVSGKKCWHLYVDILLLESCGNLYDACALATKFALGKAVLPRLVVKSDDEGQIELDLSDTNNPLVDTFSLVNVDDNVPYSISVCKIGNSYVCDADLKEESVTKVRCTFGFDSAGNIRFACKDGFGSLDPDSLYSIIDVVV